MWDADTPAISAGLRGLVGEEIRRSSAPDRDLHSGYFGGAAANPIHILSVDPGRACAIANGQRHAFEVFYDGVDETPDDDQGDVGCKLGRRRRRTSWAKSACLSFPRARRRPLGAMN
jgi:hypothetical protein